MRKTDGFSKLSLDQLVKLRDQIDALIEQRKVEEKSALKKRLEEMASKAGFDVKDLFGGARKGRGRAAGVKYRNPKNPAQTWTGRGRKPLWLVDAEKSGKKLESFKV